MRGPNIKQYRGVYGLNKYAIWFSMVELSPINKYTIIKNFSSFKELWDFIYEDEFKKSSYIKERLIDKFKAAYDKEKIDKIEEIIFKENIGITTIFDDNYPEKLRDIVDPPCVLYYKGSLDSINHKSVSVVGARECTLYGENVTKEICKILTQNSINIISGLAKGVDSIAHRVCTKKKNYTCGVLGCGINNIYPKENKGLYKEVENYGVIISEYVPNTRPNAWNFPIRNRIISGLSDLLIIVEASGKSGSLITANLALEQGREVMAVPGSIFSRYSIGTNELIKDGAHIFTNSKDLYELLNIEEKSIKNFKNNVNFTKEQSEIFGVLTDRPMHIDDISKLTNIDIECLHGLLFEMQVFSKVKCICGNYYVKIEELA